jgi:hypothetical protein
MRRLFIILLLISISACSSANGAMQQTPKVLPSFGIGLNYWAGQWSDAERRQLAQLPLTYVRWGGNESDDHWHDTSAIERFVNETRAINNAEPIYQLPALNTTPERAAAVVQTINIEKRLGVRYWSIGNEPDLFKQIHHNDMSIEEYTELWRACATAMLAVDPSIVLVGPDVSQMPNPSDPNSNLWQWFDAFMKANGDMVGVVAFHYYPFGPDDVSPATITASPDKYVRGLTALRAYLDDTLMRKVPVMLTETSLSWAGDATGNQSSASLYAGLWLTETIGISQQQGLAAVIPWTAVRNGSYSILDSSNTPRPTYYALQVYADDGKPTSTQTNIPNVKRYQNTLQNGEVIAVVVNRLANPVKFRIGSNASTQLMLGPYSFTRYHANSAQSDAKLLDGVTYGQSEFNAHSGLSAISIASK